MNFRELQAIRRVFLLKLYNFTGGDRWLIPSMFDIGRSLGIDDGQIRSISTYFHQKGLIKIETMSGDISITAAGVDEAESYLEEHDKIISSDDIRDMVNLINEKLDLLLLGQEILYTDIMEKFEDGESIQKKDFILIVLSELFSRGINGITVAQFLNILK